MAVDVSYEGVVLARGAEVRQTPGGLYVALELPMPVGTSLSLDEKGRAFAVKVARVHEGIGPGVIVAGAALPLPDVVVAPESVPQHSSGTNGAAAPVAAGPPPPAPTNEETPVAAPPSPSRTVEMEADAPPSEMDMEPPPGPPPSDSPTPPRTIEMEAPPSDSRPPSRAIEMEAPPEDDLTPPPVEEPQVEAKKGDAGPLADDGRKTVQMAAFSIEELEKLNQSMNKPSDTDPGHKGPNDTDPGPGPGDTDPGPNDTMARKGGGGGNRRKRKKTLSGT